MPARRSNNEGRRLLPDPDPDYIQELRKKVTYEGSSKHKATPHRYNLDPFHGARGDATLCDRDAGFGPERMQFIPGIIDRSLRAGLVGRNGIIWAIADDGWIFEARITIPGQAQYHGYPVRSTEAIAQPVYERFAKWTAASGNQQAIQAAEICKHIYGFK